jgi:hypothetical protein
MVARRSPRLPVLLRELGLELACLGQLRFDADASRRRCGGCARPRVLGCIPVAGLCRIRAVGMVIDDNHEVLVRWVVASDAGAVGGTELVVRSVEEPLEHH